MTIPGRQPASRQAHYPKVTATDPTLSVVVVIFTVVDGDLQALLIRRSAEPHQGMWAVPGGLLTSGESLVDAATRQLVDETGVRNVFLEHLYTFADLDKGTPGDSLARRLLIAADRMLLRLYTFVKGHTKISDRLMDRILRRL